jgi:hypothetical protein
MASALGAEAAFARPVAIRNPIAKTDVLAILRIDLPLRYIFRIVIAAEFT